MDKQQPKSVLIIDDAKVVQRFAEAFFTRLRFDVFVASDGYEGLQQVLLRKPDLILIDIMMPRLNGLKALQVIKSKDQIKDVPVLVMTAYSDRINVVSAAKLGAAAVITKPLTEEILFDKLKQVFGEESVKSMVSSESKEKDNPFGVTEEEFSDAVRAMIDEFVKYYSEQVDQLETAVHDHNVSLVRRITHNIRGTGGSFGYREASRLAGKLNELMHSSSVNWHEADLLLSQLRERHW